ncbi:ABC transporter ATP-binding protein [Halogeometricum sp. CBA1124]|uniref:oligopeptide/dipeptide ABC transporter ATP-binding protein n=1 Tax=Halogeometricum sp. CBA1124 TaxID=2668071 RepID=UPI0018D231FD
MSQRHIEDTTDESRAPLLDVSDLSVRFDGSDEQVYAVNGVDLSVERGETVGIVGESGSGKSVTALSVLKMLEDTASVTGTVRFDGEDLLTLDDDAMRDLRGDRISMIYQDPGSSLNPVLSTGDQVSETIRTHRPPAGEGVSWLERSVLGNLFRSKDSAIRHEQSWEQTVDLFERVGIPLPEQRALEYPHEFSGGMKQRALIAMAISCQPDLLIADEPTTALDVTIEAQILDLLAEVQETFGTSILFITHDMGVVREVCDSVAVMYAGHLVERAETEALFESPKHPYTKALLRSVPRLEGGTELDPLPGQVPKFTEEPTGCPFASRCEAVNDACYDAFPPAYPVGPDDSPLSVRSRGAVAGDPVRDPPVRRSDRTYDHVAHCVLYGADETLTAPVESPTVEGTDSQVSTSAAPEGSDSR